MIYGMYVSALRHIGRVTAKDEQIIHTIYGLPNNFSDVARVVT